jgi:hypothetical protein
MWIYKAREGWHLFWAIVLTAGFMSWRHQRERTSSLS